jgi:hypothetical protein
MSKNANYIYPTLVMSNGINLGEGFRERQRKWERVKTTGIMN